MNSGCRSVYQQRVESEEADPAVVVRAVYTLEPGEVTAVEEVYGKGVLPKPTLTLSKGYENRLYFYWSIDPPLRIGIYREK